MCFDAFEGVFGREIYIYIYIERERERERKREREIGSVVITSIFYYIKIYSFWFLRWDAD